MKATLTFGGRAFEVEVQDSEWARAITVVPENETLTEKFERMIADVEVGSAIMFGSRNADDGSFTLSSFHDEILSDYSLAIGAESTGDGNYVPIFDRSCAGTIFDEVVQNNLSVSHITVELGGYFSREYEIEASDVNINWVEVFNESSEYDSAFEQWIEDSTDDYSVIGIHDVSVGVPAMLGAVVGMGSSWVPLV
jgi:hypothetical protein